MDSNIIEKKNKEKYQEQAGKGTKHFLKKKKKKGKKTPEADIKIFLKKKKKRKLNI